MRVALVSRHVNSSPRLPGGFSLRATLFPPSLSLPLPSLSLPADGPPSVGRVTCTRLSSCTYHRVYLLCHVHATFRRSVTMRYAEYDEILFPLPLSFSLFAPVCLRVCRSHPRFTLWGLASLISNSNDRYHGIDVRFAYKRCLLVAIYIRLKKKL